MVSVHAERHLEYTRYFSNLLIIKLDVLTWFEITYAPYQQVRETKIDEIAPHFFELVIVISTDKDFNTEGEVGIRVRLTLDAGFEVCFYFEKLFWVCTCDRCVKLWRVGNYADVNIAQKTVLQNFWC